VRGRQRIGLDRGVDAQSPAEGVEPFGVVHEPADVNDAKVHEGPSSHRCRDAGVRDLRRLLEGLERRVHVHVVVFLHGLAVRLDELLLRRALGESLASAAQRNRHGHARNNDNLVSRN
jgi:ribosomal protein S4